MGRGRVLILVWSMCANFTKITDLDGVYHFFMTSLSVYIRFYVMLHVIKLKSLHKSAESLCNTLLAHY